MIDLRPDLCQHFGGSEAAVFDQIMTLDGEVFRSVAQRRTLRFCLGGRGYFIKIHKGTSWKEILKNLCQLRLPVLSARNEWRAIRRLEQLNVATMKIAGFGERGVPPAWLESFLITDELVDTVSLEDFCRNWSNDPPPRQLKQALIEKVARIARKLHENGINHRDFYLCHFLLDRKTLRPAVSRERLELYLIDLHRVQIRTRAPRRWRLKDLAGLYFSSMDIGLTVRDRLRFMKIYRGRPLREILNDERKLWQTVERMALRLYRKHC